MFCAVGIDKKLAISKPDGNGQEYISACVKCQIDKYGVCSGTGILFENDYLKQKCTIFEIRRGHYHYIKTLQEIKDEILSEKECRTWLNEHGYKLDTHLCTEAKAKNL